MRGVATRGRILGLVAALLLTTAFVPAATAAADEGSTNDESFQDDAAVFGATEVVSERLRSTFGDRLISFWLDRASSPSALVVRLRGATARDLSGAQDAVDGGRDRVRVVAGTLSGAQVDDIRRRLLAALQDESVSPAAVGFNPTVERFEVTARALPPPVRERLQREAGGAPLLVQEDDSFSPRFAHLARNQYPPYEAGLELTLTDGAFVGQCTSAFTIFSAATSQFYGTTAGHCGDTGTAVAIGATGISNIGTNSLWNREPSNSDAARFFIPSVAQTDDVYTGGVNGHRDVNGQINNAGLVAGTRLCYQGITSGNNNCGNIRNDWVDLAVTLEVDGVNHTINHTWCIDWDARPGDSGGPVYRVNADNSATAAGIVSFIIVESQNPVFGDMCFTSIEWSLAELNGTLVT